MILILLSVFANITLNLLRLWVSLSLTLTYFPDICLCLFFLILLTGLWVSVSWLTSLTSVSSFLSCWQHCGSLSLDLLPWPLSLLSYLADSTVGLCLLTYFPDLCLCLFFLILLTGLWVSVSWLSSLTSVSSFLSCWQHCGSLSLDPLPYLADIT
jgi:hypothetical protein